MSFILDALRKSEHERQRSRDARNCERAVRCAAQGAPGLGDRAIVVLAIAVLGLGGAYLRSEWSAGARQARDKSRRDPGRPVGERAARRPGAGAPAAPSERPGQLTERPLARESGRSIPPAPQSSLRGASDEPPSTLAAPASADRTEEPRFARAERAARAGGQERSRSCPSAASLEAEGIAVPKLELQLVAFYDSPAERYVFINNARYKEGATLAEGPRVLSITTNGAVLSYLGREFMLTQ